MKILYIVPYVPNLIRVRPYNLIRHLVQLGHQVSVAAVLSESDEQKDVEQLTEICSRVITVQIPKIRSLVNSLFAVFQGIPMQSRYSWHPSLFHEIIELVEQENFDSIHIEHIRGVEYGLRLVTWFNQRKNYGTIPVVWDSVDCISSLMNQTIQHSKSMKNRIIAMLEVRSTARLERKAVTVFDHVLVTSPKDRNELSEVCHQDRRVEKIDVLPNGVDLDYFSPGTGRRKKDTIVVTGKMSYHANFAMVDYLVREIMPLVWTRKSDTRLQIVGKDPPQAIKAMSEDVRIEVTGTVDDIRPYLQQATLAVVPITYGAGIQNKILEAMACATPVVVSSRSTQALVAVPGRDFLMAETSEEFADAIIELLDDPQKRLEIGKSGRSYVEQHHDWLKVASKLAEIYRSSVGETIV
jgi:sugar transferase (PEP-CTERM/EpsH1 system associated)